MYFVPLSGFIICAYYCTALLLFFKYKIFLDICDLLYIQLFTFLILFFDCAGDGTATSKSPASKKGRKSADDDGGDNGGGDDDDGGGPGQGVIDIKDLDLDDLAAQKADYLKELCRSYGIPVSGNKTVLIQRLTDLKNG